MAISYKGKAYIYPITQQSHSQVFAHEKWNHVTTRNPVHKFTVVLTIIVKN